MSAPFRPITVSLPPFPLEGGAEPLTEELRAVRREYRRAHGSLLWHAGALVQVAERDVDDPTRWRFATVLSRLTFDSLTAQAAALLKLAAALPDDAEVLRPAADAAAALNDAIEQVGAYLKESLREGGHV